MMEAVAPNRETEVSAKAKRRVFTAGYKRRILDELDRATKPGEVGAILRREGLYSSVVSSWRRQRDAGTLSALRPKKRGPVAKVPHPLEREVVELKRALAKAEARAKHAEALVEVQKKVAELLGIQLAKSDEEH